MSEKKWIIPPERTRYLAEIVETCDALRRLRAHAGGASRGGCISCTARSRRCARTSARSGSRSSSRAAPTTWCRSPSASRASRRSSAELVALYQRPRGAARPRVPAPPRRVARDEEALRRGEVPVPGARQGHRARPRHRVAVAPAHPEGRRCRKLRRLGRPPDLAAARERRPATSRSPPACSRSSAKARIRRACSPAKAAPSAPTSASTTSRAACPRSACRRRSTRSRSTARIPITGPTSTARSATPACRSRTSTTRRSSTPASTSPIRRRRCR